MTYLFQNTPRAAAYLARAEARGLTTEQAAFYGAPHMVRSLLTGEFRQWWEEHWGTERITLSQWRERAAEQREQIAWEDSAERALEQLDMLRRLTLERDALILDAVSKGASKAAVGRAVGLSRQQVHTIVSNASVPDVAPFGTWENVAPTTVEADAADVWDQVF